MCSSWTIFQILILPLGSVGQQNSSNASFQGSGQQNASQAVGQQNTGACDERLTGLRGNGYRGCQTRTREGRTCMKWSVQSPHAHIRTPPNFPGKGLGDHNYCRNPDYQATIWCYTTDPNKLWEFCSPVQQVILQSVANARFELRMNGSCDNAITGGLSECSSAAAILGLSSTTAIYDGHASVGYDPPYCYFEGGVLKYNNGGANTGSCNSIDQCLCVNVHITTTTTMMTAIANATQVSSISSEANTTDGIAVGIFVGGAASLCVLVVGAVGVCRVMRRQKPDQEPQMLDPERNLPEASAPPTESGCTNGVPLAMHDARALTLLGADARGTQVEPEAFGRLEPSIQAESTAEVCQKPRACRSIIQIKLHHVPKHHDGQALLEAVDALGFRDAWVNDNFSKRETRTMDDGAAYTGDLVDNLRHGYGSLIWPDGTEYEGEWKQDKAHGKGRFVGADGDVYEGAWLEDGADGFGSYEHAANGSKYEGQWADGWQHGEGTETWSDGSKYQGQWEKGHKQGKGICSWTDKSRFEGQFKDNDIHGEGVYEWGDGRKYEGQWQANQMHGFGKFRWPDGRMHEGNYANDQMDGSGIFKWSDGRQCTGKWRKGTLRGDGEGSPSPSTPRMDLMPRALRAPHTPRTGTGELESGHWQDDVY